MIQQNINRIKSEIGETTLVAVSKYRTIEELEELYRTGQRIFAENRVQELLKRQEVLPKDIEWHLIGHLQTNKVKTIIDKVSLIHSVDSIKLLNEIQKQAEKNQIQVSILLQIHVAQEETKFGFDPNELLDLIKNGLFNQYPNITFRGLMSMATLTDSEAEIEAEFEKTRELFQQIQKINPKLNEFNLLSMGMSSDYLLAIKHGSNMVRIGSKIFS